MMKEADDHCSEVIGVQTVTNYIISTHDFAYL